MPEAIMPRHRNPDVEQEFDAVMNAIKECLRAVKELLDGTEFFLCDDIEEVLDGQCTPEEERSRLCAVTMEETGAQLNINRLARFIIGDSITHPRGIQYTGEAEVVRCLGGLTAPYANYRNEVESQRTQPGTPRG